MVLLITIITSKIFETNAFFGCLKFMLYGLPTFFCNFYEKKIAVASLMSDGSEFI